MNHEIGDLSTEHLCSETRKEGVIFFFQLPFPKRPIFSTGESYECVHEDPYIALILQRREVRGPSLLLIDFAAQCLEMRYCSLQRNFEGCLSLPVVQMLQDKTRLYEEIILGGEAKTLERQLGKTGVCHSSHLAKLRID
jgi:hypothetical protein